MTEFASEITCKAKMVFGGFRQRPGLQSRIKALCALRGPSQGCYFSVISAWRHRFRPQAAMWRFVMLGGDTSLKGHCENILPPALCLGMVWDGWGNWSAWKKTCTLGVSFHWIPSVIQFPARPHKQECHDMWCGVAWGTDGLEGPWDGMKREEKARKARARP